MRQEVLRAAINYLKHDYHPPHRRTIRYAAVIFAAWYCTIAAGFALAWYVRGLQIEQDTRPIIVHVYHDERR